MTNTILLLVWGLAFFAAAAAQAQRVHHISALVADDQFLPAVEGFKKKMAELPIEQPVKLKLVVNLKTAKPLGLKIPKGVLLRTDDVIE